MASQARKVFGAFEKRAPGLFNVVFTAKITEVKTFMKQIGNRSDKMKKPLLAGYK